MLVTVFCPDCPRVMSKRVPLTQVGQVLRVVEQNVQGYDVDHYECPQCEALFQISYKVDEVKKIEGEG